MPENRPLRPFVFAAAGFVLGLATWILLSILLPNDGLSDALALARDLGMTSLTLREGYDKSQEVRLWALGTFVVPGGLWIGWILATRNRPGARKTQTGAGSELPSVASSPKVTRTLPWAVVAIAAIATTFRPDVLHGANPWGNFGLLAEEGVYLGAIQALRSGRTLYSELYFPYGPLLIQPLEPWLAIFGDTISAARAYVLLLHGLGVVGCALCVRLALGRSRMSHWSAAAAAIAIALLAPTTLPNLNSALLRVVFAFLPVTMLLAGLRWWRHLPAGPTPALTPFHLAGGLAAIAALLSLEVGVAALFGITVTLLLARSGHRPWLQTLTGLVVILTAALLPLARSGGLTAFAQQSVQAVGLSALGYQALPYPDVLGLFVDAKGVRGAWPREGLDAATRLWSTIPPLLCWLALGTGAAGTLGVTPRKPGLPLLALGSCAFVLTYASLGRSDLYHLWFYGAVPTVLILTLLSVRSWSLFSGRFRLVVPLVATLTALAMFATRPMEKVKLQGEHPAADSTRLELKRTGSIDTDTATAAQIEAVLSWTARLPEEEGVWFYPSEAMFYFLAERPPPNSFLWAYDAPSRDLQERAIAELSKSPPRWLVRSHLGFAIDWIPEADLLPQLSLYVQSNYETVGMLPGATLMKRIDR